jgi:Leucine-rich repeat (LRR) protein
MKIQTGLTHLEELSLEMNQIDNLLPLAELTDLKLLTVTTNSVSDVRIDRADEAYAR